MKKYLKIMALACVILMVMIGCGTKDDGNSLSQNGVMSEIETEQNSISSQSAESEVQETEIATETLLEQETELKSTTIMYAVSSVNVRSLPSADGEKLGRLNTNQEVIAVGDVIDGWQEIIYNNETAYVSAKYLGTEKVEVQAYVPQMQVDEITAADLSVPADFDPNGIVVVIDPGHQGKGNSQKEPDGPGSSVLKAKVSSGATGCSTKQPEYILNLQVALKLRDELKSRGYQVVMIRENHEINISNSERAKFANSLDADAFIRIHANSSDNSSVSGVETICQTSSNPYNAHLYSECRRLSDCILEEFVNSTGARKRHVWETDTMSGINWCEVPVTILEMGFLSNPEEDRLMASDDYQNKMVQGIANGLDKYFGR